MADPPPKSSHRGRPPSRAAARLAMQKMRRSKEKKRKRYTDSASSGEDDESEEEAEEEEALASSSAPGSGGPPLATLPEARKAKRRTREVVGWPFVILSWATTAEAALRRAAKLERENKRLLEEIQRITSEYADQITGLEEEAVREKQKLSKLVYLAFAAGFDECKRRIKGAYPDTGIDFDRFVARPPAEAEVDPQGPEGKGREEEVGEGEEEEKGESGDGEKEEEGDEEEDKEEEEEGDEGGSSQHDA